MDTTDDDLWERPPTGLYIYPDAFDGAPMSTLESLMSHISPCDVKFAADSSIHSDAFKDILDIPEGLLLVSIYDRAPLVADWYYSLYGIPSSTSSSNYDCSPNPIVNSVMPKGSQVVTGPALVVLNGPKEGMWEVKETIDEEKFARTIWWYLRSGNDVNQVFGEREFHRFLKSFA